MRWFVGLLCLICACADESPPSQDTDDGGRRIDASSADATTPDGAVVRTDGAADASTDGGFIPDTGIFRDAGPGAPLNPPPLSSTAPTAFSDQIAFLYEGPEAPQQDVAPGSIEPLQAAVLRGRTTTPDGTPLAGVEVRTPGAPEWGRTFTRIDGTYDLVINGGGTVTIRFQMTGYLTVDRTASPAWNAFVPLDDVVLTPLDPASTPITLGAATPQVARATEVQDKDGARRATVIFSRDTNATMKLSDGTRQPLSMGTFRATEFTVGDRGLAAMPGPLPAASAYTYAVELGFDEALSADSVELDKPVALYVENFLDFPVGTGVPVGFYDRSRQAWVPEPRGRVIRIVASTGTLAGVDMDGDGAGDDAAKLSTIGITDEERAELARLYATDTSLWRVSIRHFTPYDCNWPYGPPLDASPPNAGPPKGGDQDKDPDPECEEGCVIEPANQVLGEAIRVWGTPYKLVYRSDRLPGRRAANKIDIPLSGPGPVPASVRWFDAQVEVAGRRFDFRASPEPDRTAQFEWDGLDAYGRVVQGTIEAAVTVAWKYPAVYFGDDVAGFERSFGRLATENFPGSPFAVRASRNSSQIVLERRSTLRMGSRPTHNNLEAGFGGFSLSHHHAYDPTTQTVFFGDGHQERLLSDGALLEKVLGGPENGFSGDGGPATAARTTHILGLATAPDGSLYLADGYNHRIRRVDPTGIIDTVAGTGGDRFEYPGLPGLQTGLGVVSDLALTPDGGLVLAIQGYLVRIPRGGVLEIVAGKNGFAGTDEDGHLGKDTNFYGGRPAVAKDGTIYYLENQLRKIRRIGLDGVITSPVTFTFPACAFALGPDESMYTADCQTGVIRRYRLNGPNETWESGATFPRGLTVDRDGNIFVLDANLNQVRWIGRDGVSRVIAGTETVGSTEEGGRARDTTLRGVAAIALAPDGAIYVADNDSDGLVPTLDRIVVIRNRRAPGTTDLLVPSPNGDEEYVFTASGRHRETRERRTSATIRTFEYDPDGRLTAIVERGDRRTQVERDAEGKPTAIIGPTGIRTGLTTGSHGYLEQVAAPTGSTDRFTFSDDGLITSHTDPLGRRSEYSFDADGRLLADAQPDGGGWQLTREGTRVVLQSHLGRRTIHSSEETTEAFIRRVERPDGTVETTATGADGIVRTFYSDGSIMTTKPGYDPVSRTSYVQEWTMETPGGRRFVSAMTRSGDQESTTVNGETWTSVWDPVQRRFTRTSPEGRTQIIDLDQRGLGSRRTIGSILPVEQTYDSAGRLTSFTHGQRGAQITRNADDSIVTTRDTLGRETSIHYDEALRPVRVEHPDTGVTAFAYDLRSELASVTPPGRSAHTLELDDRGQRIAHHLPGGRTRTTRFDLDGDLISADGLTHERNSLGQVTRTTFGRGEAVRSYDSAGRPTSLTSPDGITLTRTWDGPLVTAVRFIDGAISRDVTIEHDTFLRPASRRVAGSAPIVYGYDRDGLITRAGELTLELDGDAGAVARAVAGGVVDTFTRDAYGDMATHEVRYDGTLIYREALERDALGRAQAVTEDGSRTEFAYDAAGRLTQASRNGVPVAAASYDGNGNRVDLGGTSELDDRLLSHDTTTLTWDAAGRLASRANPTGTTNYVYDEQGSLLEVDPPVGSTVQYRVDGVGRRAARRVGNTTTHRYLYDETGRLIGVLDGSGALVARFAYAMHGHVPDLMMTGMNTYRLVTDRLGSVRLVVDIATGQVAQRLAYDVFGRVTSDTQPGFQPFGFAGGLYDAATGLVRFGARDLDPETGRWTAPDPIGFGGGDTNLYAYCAGDPVNCVDPTGLFSEKTKCLIKKYLDQTKKGDDPVDYLNYDWEAAWDAAFQDRYSADGGIHELDPDYRAAEHYLVAAVNSGPGALGGIGTAASDVYAVFWLVENLWNGKVPDGSQLEADFAGGLARLGRYWLPEPAGDCCNE